MCMADNDAVNGLDEVTVKNDQDESDLFFVRLNPNEKIQHMIFVACFIIFQIEGM